MGAARVSTPSAAPQTRARTGSSALRRSSRQPRCGRGVRCVAYAVEHLFAARVMLRRVSGAVQCACVVDQPSAGSNQLIGPGIKPCLDLGAAPQAWTTVDSSALHAYRVLSGRLCVSLCQFAEQVTRWNSNTSVLLPNRATKWTASFAQAQQFGVQDVRVEAVQSKDMGRFVLPTIGVVAAAILAGDRPTARGLSAKHHSRHEHVIHALS